jgi:copper chaperone
MSTHTATYTVSGMTCAHCVNAVTAELGEIPGVSDVRVDLDSGQVTVTSDAPVADEAVAAAVDEAGYAVVDYRPSSTPGGLAP